MRTPSLSIITICYNDPEGLTRTLASLLPLLDQSRFTWEHLIVDSSPEVHDPIFKRFPQLHHRREIRAPKGIYDALNAALEMVQGDIVWFLNSGDECLDLESLSKGVESVASPNGPEILIGGAAMFRDRRFLYTAFSPKNFRTALLGRNWICHQAMLYASHVFKKVGPFITSVTNTGDYDHHLRCLEMGIKVEFTNLVFAAYDRGGGSDQTALVFREFKMIHSWHAHAFTPTQRFSHGFVRVVEFRRIQLVKGLGALGLRPVLLPVWRRVLSCWHGLRRRTLANVGQPLK